MNLEVGDVSTASLENDERDKMKMFIVHPLLTLEPDSALIRILFLNRQAWCIDYVMRHVPDINALEQI